MKKVLFAALLVLAACGEPPTPAQQSVRDAADARIGKLRQEARNTDKPVQLTTTPDGTVLWTYYDAYADRWIYFTSGSANHTTSWLEHRGKSTIQQMVSGND